MSYQINFPHLHISLQHVIKSFTIGNFTIAMYGILIAIGMVLGIIVARREARRTGQDPDEYLTFGVMAIIISVVCARIYYVVFSWDLYKDNLLSVFNVRQGGLAIYGGVIGAIISALLYSKIRKIRLGTLLDTGVLGLVLGQIIGRWGNFFNREAFGTYTNNIFAMQLPVSAVREQDIDSILADHIKVIDDIQYIQVHPTFLYECLWNIGVLIALLFLRKRKKFEGEVFAWYLLLYGAGRAWIEGLRTDQLLVPGTDIAVSQVLSIVLVIIALLLIILIRHKKKALMSANLASIQGELAKSEAEAEASETAAAKEETAAAKEKIPAENTEQDKEETSGADETPEIENDKPEEASDAEEVSEETDEVSAEDDTSEGETEASELASEETK